MTYQDKDSRGSIHRYLSRWLRGGGALAAAILLAGLGLSTSTVQAQEPEPAPAGALVFEGLWEPIFDFLPQPDGDGVPDCGGGDIIITVTPDRTEVFSIAGTGFTSAGVLDDFAFQFQPGEAPIDQDGNFSIVFEDQEVPVSARNQGKFDFDADPQTVSGTGTVFPTADPTNIFCEPDYTATQVKAVALAPTGSGPASASGNGMTLWALVAASLGALTLATGLALRRRA